MTDLSVCVVTTTDTLSDIESLQTLADRDTIDYETVVRTDSKGIGYARNRAIEAASGDKLVFIDDDAIPAPGYLDAVADALDKHAVVTGPVEQSEDGIHHLEWDRSESDLIGCNMGFRREVFQNVGGFNETMPYGHDETELQARLHNEYEVHWIEGMRVQHAYAESVLGYWRKMWNMGKADVWYGLEVGTNGEQSTGDGVVRTVLHPSQFVGDTPKATAIKAPGRVIRNLSIGLAAVRYMAD
jgi:glycosyltransferase involved in cell wall biosynthesis